MIAPHQLIHTLEARIAAEPLEALRSVVALAIERRLRPYLVGGPVRDLLLGQSPRDIDIVVEGDALGLAAAAGQATGLRVGLHRPFGTATLTGARFTIDLVTARKERYARPGALPSVEPSNLTDDLLRRDFTINAMALALAGPEAGTIVDPSGGRDDLDGRLVRVLHDQSFADDPTRLMRAARYAARLRFALEPHTRRLIDRDRGGLALLSPARLRHELDRILGEAEPERALLLAADLGLLAATGAPLVFPPRAAIAFAELRTTTAERERAGVGWAIMGAALAPSQASVAAKRLGLPKRDRAALAGASELSHSARLARASPSAVANVAGVFAPSAVWGAALAGPEPELRDALMRYLAETRYVRPELEAADLVALGVAEGPPLGRIAARLRDARRDGLVRTREDELALVRRTLRLPEEGPNT